MFALPFEDDRFDVATSFNGIWKGCEDALREARRVVRPGGLLGRQGRGTLQRQRCRHDPPKITLSGRSAAMRSQSS